MLTCALCGAFYKRISLVFNSGSTEPQVDEVLTGATSSDTGTVVEVDLISGSWAGGDAAGEVVLKDASGVDDNGDWGEAEEDINGSVGGSNVLTTAQVGIEQSFGQRYPLSFMTKYKGKWYCRPHARFKQESDILKREIDLDVSELESKRGELPE